MMVIMCDMYYTSLMDAHCNDIDIGDMIYHGHLNKQVEISKTSNKMEADLERHFFMYMFLSSYLVTVVGMLM